MPCMRQTWQKDDTFFKKTFTLNHIILNCLSLILSDLDVMHSAINVNIWDVKVLILFYLYKKEILF